MKMPIVADGPRRFEKSQELQARLAELRRTIEQRYAAQLVGAGWLRRLYLRWKIATEYHCEARRLYPSTKSLYSNR